MLGIRQNEVALEASNKRNCIIRSLYHTFTLGIIVTLAVFLIKYMLLTDKLQKEKLKVEQLLSAKEMLLIKKDRKIKHLKVSQKNGNALNTALYVENRSKD